jgi:hypothetical protein
MLLHFDAPGSLAQSCGSGADAVLGGSQPWALTASRNAALADAYRAEGTGEEAWIDTMKLTPASGNLTIEMSIRKLGSAFDGRAYALLYSDQDAVAGNQTGVRVYVVNDGRLGVGTNNGMGGETVVESLGGVIFENVWHHVAVTIDASEIRLFIDGAIHPVSSGPPAWVASPLTAWLGAGREGSSGTDAIYRFNGEIDEVRVSNISRY